MLGVRVMRIGVGVGIVGVVYCYVEVWLQKLG